MENLPIHALREALRREIERCRPLIVTAPTGSGKSTQVPQIILDSGACEGRILVLEPRRLAARMLAARVAEERNSRLGAEVGYVTRFERALSAASRLVFATDGILLRRLADDPVLDGIGALVLDEYHERSLAADLGLALARRLQQRRPELRIVVMSATLDVKLVQAFLPHAVHLNAEGRRYPVQIRYAAAVAKQPPWDGAAAALKTLLADTAGDILVFMPGVRHVIDSGLARISRHDPGRGFNALVTEPISRAAAEQRAGRAGREGPGTCTRLWTEAEQNVRPARTEPEISRVDLAGAVVLLKALGIPCLKQFAWVEEPNAVAVEGAVALLELLGILSAQTGALTDMGRAVARFPAHPRLAVLMLMAHRCGCFETATQMAALLGERNVLLDRRRRLPEASAPAAAAADTRTSVPDGPESSEPESDLVLLATHLQRAAAADFDALTCQQLGLRPGASRQVWRAAQVLSRSGRSVGCGHDSPPQRDSAAALAKCIMHAFPDRIAKRRDGGTLICSLPDGRRGELTRASVVRNSPLLVAAEIRELTQPGRPPKTLLSMATGIRAEWLQECFPHAWQVEEQLVWDGRRRQVLGRTRVVCHGLVLRETESHDVDPAAAAAMLAARIQAEELRLHGWNRDVKLWIARTRWLAEQVPEQQILTYDETDVALLLQQICHGARRYRDVKDKPCLEIVRAALGAAGRDFVEKMAPARIQFPGGYRLRLEYHGGQAPKGRARIQDLYGVEKTPRVCGGRVPVLLEILAPNMRTVQITDDLPRFWRHGYPAAKRQWQHRYPKHEWR